VRQKKEDWLVRQKKEDWLILFTSFDFVADFCLSPETLNLSWLPGSELETFSSRLG
jgi:hypothetical protein